MKKLLLGTILVFTALLLSTISSSAGTAVPHFLNYQSLLYDDGGNLLADQPAGMTFRITDAAGSVLYEERQTLDVVHGAVSALVGNGQDANNAPMGGIPASVLTPDGARYLEVTVDGYSPESGLEIVSVPYSVYAEKALSVADEAVTGAMLAKKIITMDHLADGLVDQLAGEMSARGALATRTDLTNMQTTYRAASGAGNIGVNGGFVYSGNTNIQGVLQDLDRSIQKRQSEIEAHAGSASNVHGVTGNVVGTHDAQILSNKTLVAPNVSGGMTVTGGNIIMNGNNITGLPDPSLPSDAAKMSYVDNAVSAEASARNSQDNALDNRLLEIENKPKIRAWGTVKCADPPVFNGWNINVTRDALILFNISFNESLPSAGYAVIITLQDYDYYQMQANPFAVLNKTQNGFQVRFPLEKLPSAFDFIVVGQ